MSGGGRRTRLWTPTVGRNAAVAAWLACLALSLRAIDALRRASPDSERLDVLGDWIPKLPVATRDAMGILEVPWGLRLDPKSALLLLVVVACPALAHAYARRLTTTDTPAQGLRRSAFLCGNLAFLVLVALGSNLPVVLAGWVGVVMTSAWFGRRAIGGGEVGADGATLVAVGVTAFMLAIGLAFATFGTVDIRAVERAATSAPAELTRWGAASSIILFLLAGVLISCGALVPRRRGAPGLEQPHAALAGWFAAVAGLAVIWQVSTLMARAPVALGVAVAVSGVVLWLNRRCGALSS